MNQQIQKISHRLDQIFKGQTWYGEPIFPKLKQLNFQHLNDKANDHSASIAQLLKHMINWRHFVIAKLNGDADYSIKMNSEEDWPQLTLEDESEWNQLLDQLKESQEIIQQLLSDKQDILLTQKVPGKAYNYELMLEGIIQHDLYHFGQICFLHKRLYSKIVL